MSSLESTKNRQIHLSGERKDKSKAKQRKKRTTPLLGTSTAQTVRMELQQRKIYMRYIQHSLNNLRPFFSLKNVPFSICSRVFSRR